MSIFDPSLQGFLWVLAIAMTVLVLDIFFETEFLSLAALIGISIYLSLLFDVSTKWTILISLGCLSVLIAIFYLLWKQMIAPLVRRCLPSGADEAIHSAVGATATFRKINEKTFVEWNGDLWPVDVSSDSPRFSDRAPVKITSVENGVFSITTL